MPWASITKCVFGASSMMSWTNCGMLSRGVLAPESICKGSRMSMSSRPSCGMERAIVPKNMPIAVVAYRWTAVPATKSGTEPCSGAPIQ